MLFVPPQPIARQLSELAFLTAATALTASIVCPSISQFDIAVLFDTIYNLGGGPAVNVVPAGFTQLQTSSGLTERTTLSCRILDGSEGGSSIVGMSGVTGSAKILLILRPNGVVASVGLSTFLQETSSGNPAAQSIAAAGNQAPLVRLSCGAISQGPSAPPFTSGAFDATVAAGSGGTYLRAGYAIQNVAPSNDTVDIADTGSGSCLISGWFAAA